MKKPPPGPPKLPPDPPKPPKSTKQTIEADHYEPLECPGNFQEISWTFPGRNGPSLPEYSGLIGYQDEKDASS